MSIVHELQRQAIESKDIDNLLRKAYMVSKKLNLKEFENWIFNELNGYKNEDEIPEYRKTKGKLKAKDMYRGIYIPVVIKDLELYNTIVTKQIWQSVIELDNLVKHEAEELYTEMNMEQNMLLSTMVGEYTEFVISTNKIVFIKIINEVKNRILEWSIDLENDGILGKGMSFSDKEKEIAAEKIVTNNYITTSGDVAIQQSTKDSTQIQNNSNKCLDNKIFNELKETASKMESKDKVQIIDAINELEKSQNSPSFKEKYNEFIQSVANHMTIFSPFIPMLSTLL